MHFYHDGWIFKGSDWIRLVFAHPFPMNSRAPIALENIISDGKVQVSSYGVALSYTLIMDLAQLMGAPLLKINGWAQSNELLFQSDPIHPNTKQFFLHKSFY